MDIWRERERERERDGQTDAKPVTFLFPTADSENRSMCINDLRNILSNLHTEDYVRFVNDILGNRCHGNDTVCEDKRLVVIDVVARLGDVTSQDLLMTHVLFREPTISEELRRVFMHCVAMEQPTEVRQWTGNWCLRPYQLPMLSHLASDRVSVEREENCLE